MNTEYIFCFYVNQTDWFLQDNQILVLGAGLKEHIVWVCIIPSDNHP